MMGMMIIDLQDQEAELVKLLSSLDKRKIESVAASLKETLDEASFGLVVDSFKLVGKSKLDKSAGSS